MTGGMPPGRTDGVGMVMNPGPWVIYQAGESARCPAPTGLDGAACERRFRDVGAGIRFLVRVRAYQGLDKPMKGTTTHKCVKCAAILECKEEHP